MTIISTSFLLFMVEGFGFRVERGAGYWTGILVCSFFLSQFMTSMLWAASAEKYSMHALIFASLLGSSLTCFAFGLSKSLRHALCIRLLQGAFAGTVGLGRGNVAAVADSSNEGRTYAVLGFAWGLGGVSGAVVGGASSNSGLFANYPYLLPMAVASSVTLIVALLCLSLAPDGGPRETFRRAPLEKVSTTDTTVTYDSTREQEMIEDAVERRTIPEAPEITTDAQPNLGSARQGPPQEVDD